MSCVKEYIVLLTEYIYIYVARVNEYRTTDVTRVLKTPDAEVSQYACGERTKNILFSSMFSRVLNE